MFKRKSINKHTGIVIPMIFLLMFIVDSLLIHLANQFFPEAIVLGNDKIKYLWAIIHSMSTLALINTLMLPIMRLYENAKKASLSIQEKFVFNFLTNLGGLFLISRLAVQLGLGISAWYVTALLAIIFSTVQMMVLILFHTVKKNCKC